MKRALTGLERSAGGAGTEAEGVSHLLRLMSSRVIYYSLFEIRCHACLPALRHRIILRPEAELEGLDTDRVLTDVLAAVEVPK